MTRRPSPHTLPVKTPPPSEQTPPTGCPVPFFPPTLAENSAFNWLKRKLFPAFFSLIWMRFIKCCCPLSDLDQSHYQCSCKLMAERAGRRVTLNTTAVPSSDKDLIKACCCHCCCFRSIMEIFHQHHCFICSGTSHKTPTKR
ncbi:hypothetical protein IRJ41_013826 [Triplophysa rosa]|uniref:Uncharacterized protein n=1 Tax=Triplophysa rosa TaxID=992332 RepID=A0A9W7TGL0_TRIRA|nr:hypothetical protein IRJ41_013826 [Triplophysa rosa]